jgi:hypothetical protein
VIRVSTAINAALWVAAIVAIVRRRRVERGIDPRTVRLLLEEGARIEREAHARSRQA